MNWKKEPSVLLLLCMSVLATAPCLAAGSHDGLGPAAQLAQTDTRVSDEAAGLTLVVVDDWWGSRSDRRYSLLSRAYKARLRRALKVSNARQYDRAVDVPERVWGKRTTREVKQLGQGAVQVSVLVEWSQEGYDGVMTFVFDLLKEGGVWRIANIMH